MKKAALLVALVFVAIITSSAIASPSPYKGTPYKGTPYKGTTASGKTCWQAKLTFVNFPASPDSFARWSLTQGGHVYAHGEFSFHGDAGGFYQRVISRCVSGIDPWAKHGPRVKLDWASYVNCPDCKASRPVIRRTA